MTPRCVTLLFFQYMLLGINWPHLADPQVHSYALSTVRYSVPCQKTLCIPQSAWQYCDSFTSAVSHYRGRGSWQLVPYWHDIMWLQWYLLQQDTCGVKHDPDSLPAETAAFSMRELIAVKRELQEDAKVSHSSHFMNNIATATTWKVLYTGALGDSALCGSNVKALCRSFLLVSTDRVGYCESLCVTCWLLVLPCGCVRRYSARYWPPALRVWWSLQWLVVQFLYHSTVPCVCCVHQQSTSAVPCTCSCSYWI